MEITTLFVVIAVFIIMIMFWPDMFPYCSNCKKVKPRFMFKIHKSVSLRMGYGANKSVCKKCCRKYRVESFSDYQQVEHIKRRIEHRLQNKL